MTTCKLNFFGESKALAEGIYADLQKLGVQCKDMDGGYQVTNYAGIHCPNKTDRSCIKGSGDSVVEATEVLEYAFNNYEKYREILEGRLGSKLPWLLDDFDPKTDFDAKIRAQVQSAIAEVKRILAAKGLKEGTPEYQEKLAVGLFWFVAYPRKGLELNPHGIQSFNKKIQQDGFSDFLEYLLANGGLASVGDMTKEYSALEAIKNGYGECTEKSNILFAVLKMAGISSLFVDEDVFQENSVELQKRVKALAYEYPVRHVLIAFSVKSGLRLFDPSLIDSNANYDNYTTLSLRQYYSQSLIGHASTWYNTDQFDKAVKVYSQSLVVDPNSTFALVARGQSLENKKDFTASISDYQEAIRLDPKNAAAWHGLGHVYHAKGELNGAIEAYERAIELYPAYQAAYLDLGDVWFDKRSWRKAILAFTKFSAMKDDLIVYARMGICWYAVGDIKKSLVEFSKSLKMSTAGFSLFSIEVTSLFGLLRKDGNQGFADIFKKESGIEIFKFEANILLTYALWLNDKKDEARSEFFDATNMDITFRGKPSKETKQFIEKMLAAMPAAMKKDKEVKDSIKMLRSNY